MPKGQGCIGSLREVGRPDGQPVTFTYDALGRRISKTFQGITTRWLWDGNTPLHEWREDVTAPLPDKNEITTWVFDEGTFRPAAKLVGDKAYSIITDYLGTPAEMYDAEGIKTWQAEFDIYGKFRTFAGRSLNDCPFLYQGQYLDSETELVYNRYRYYDSSTGAYISQDPIGLAGGNPTLYGYVFDSNIEIDPLGLKKYIVYQAPVLDANGKPTGKVYTGRTSGADDMTREQILNRRKSNHHRKDIGRLRPIFETDNYKAVRGAEHYYIEEARKTGKAADQIAGISDRNFEKNGKKLKGDEYMEAFFKEKPDLKQPKSSKLSICR